MGVGKWIVLLFRPRDFKTLLEFALYYKPKRDITAVEEHPTSGWDRESMRRCWQLLDMTSRSFATVIKEADGDLARTICIFYLVLRGLDTIEDDMTLPDEEKQTLLRSFHKHTVTPGWNFNGSGPNEKDRQLLVEYHHVVEELNRLPLEYREIIVDITEKMQVGMADYTHAACVGGGTIYIQKVVDYDLYCYYSAGVVAEGLARIVSAAGKEAPSISGLLEMTSSIGLLMQKTNILRDYREDTEQRRYFWPKEIWGKKQYGFNEMREMYEAIEADGGRVTSQKAKTALYVQSELVVDALRHTTDVLDGFSLLRDEGVFRAIAVPTTMAMATLQLCFMNPEVFLGRVKISKADSVRVFMGANNARGTVAMWVEYARKIRAKADPSDPNFLKISIACGRVEQWRERHYPSFVELSHGKEVFKRSDARTAIVQLQAEHDLELAKKKGAKEISMHGSASGTPGSDAAHIGSVLLHGILFCGASVWFFKWADVAPVNSALVYARDRFMRL